LVLSFILSYKITLPVLVPVLLLQVLLLLLLVQVLQVVQVVQVLLLLQLLPVLLRGPVRVRVRALQALPEPELGPPALLLPQASAPQPSCNQRLRRIMSQRKALKTERIRSSSSRYHLLSNNFYQSLYFSNYSTSLERVQALLPEREPVLQALPQVPGPVLRALPGPEPGLPALQLPRVSAPQPSYNQRLQRIMPQRKPPK